MSRIRRHPLIDSADHAAWVAGIRRAIKSIEREGTIPHAEVEKWVRSWGSRNEHPMPKPSRRRPMAEQAERATRFTRHDDWHIALVGQKTSYV